MKAILIGLGMVADTHLAALSDNAAGVSLVAVMGRDPKRVQTYAAKASERLGAGVHGITALADAPDFDLAIIATPPDARVDLVEQLVPMGKPILMEKPIERTLKVAQKIVHTCAVAGVPLGLVFQHRVRAASLALAQELPRLGPIATVDIRVPWWRDQSYYDEPGRGSYARDGGGAMISQAIHTLDLALSLAGPVVEVQAMMQQTPLHNLGAEDWAAALLTFKSGAVGTLTATTAAYPGSAESITLQGLQGSAHLQEGVLKLSLLDGTVETHGSAATTGGGADPMAFTHAWHQSILEDFAGAIRLGRPPVASGEAGLLSHAVIDAMERAAKSKTVEKVVQI